MEDNLWLTNVLAENSWQFIIALDNTYGFDPIHPSSISITVNAPWVDATEELLFGFSTDNEHYVSIAIPLSNPRQSNQIYPACIPSLRSTQSFAFGDIAALPRSDRKCDISHGSCTKWRSMVPSRYDIQMPITFTLEHSPSDQILEIYFEDASYTRSIQRCSFAQGYTLNTGLKTYIGAKSAGDSYIISSFEVQSTIIRPTSAPTKEPTYTPTKRTRYPTPDPTPNPTPNPATYKPTSQPTNLTLDPTNDPTENTRYPTGSPSQSPTLSTRNPTTSNPTIKPTKQPSVTPTPAPSYRPTPDGFVWGAFDQLCPNSVTMTGLCRDVTDIYFSDNIMCWQPYDCCMCAQIECGMRDVNAPCKRLTIGPSGVAGVKDITVMGSLMGPNAGAVIDCQGIESCHSSDIVGTHVRTVDCDGDRSCQDATITITDPTAAFVLDCGGIESCHNLQIDIYFSEEEGGCGDQSMMNTFRMDKITCANRRSCEGLQITVNNAGCDVVMIDTLECVQHDACNGAVFDFIGAVGIDHCKCGPSCANAQGLESCYEGLAFLKCTDPRACASQVSTVTNPRNGFEFICSDVSSCMAATFTLELTHDIGKPTSKLGKFIFSGEYAAQGATFIIDNDQAIDMAVELVECAGPMSCYGTTFVLKGSVYIEKFVCAPGACEGCVIKQTSGAAGVPCGMWAVNSMV
eukprot:170801_1